MPTRRPAVLAVLLGLALTLPLATPVAAAAADQPATDDRGTLRRYAADTWRSFELLLDPGTGLPSDNVSAAGERSRYTSPTNVGAYLWSTLAARDAGIISPSAARMRIAATLASVARLERHQPSGMFYNWYDPATGAKLTTSPVDGNAAPSCAARPATCWTRWTSAPTTTRRPGCCGAGSGSTRRAASARPPATTATPSARRCSTPATTTAA
jgi:hypothetical protein